MGDHESRLAKLAEIGRETEDTFQARMEKRALRIVHKIEGWDRDNLAERYAWMLLLACELRKTCRVLENHGDLHKRLESASRHKAEILEDLAVDAMRKTAKAESDRKRGAAAKLAKDPKQAAKKEAFEMWKAWHAGRARYKSGAAFARHVVDVLPLESSKQVERWVTKWRREAQAAK